MNRPPSFRPPCSSVRIEVPCSAPVMAPPTFSVASIPGGGGPPLVMAWATLAVASILGGGRFPLVMARATLAGASIGGGGRSPLVMARLDRAIGSGTMLVSGLPAHPRGGVRRATSPGQVVEQVVPTRIEALDQVQLPRPRPMLQPRLAPDRDRDLLVTFHVNKTNDPVARGEAGPMALPMLPRPARDVVRDTDIKRAERPIGHDVNPSTLHASIFACDGLRKCERAGEISRLGLRRGRHLHASSRPGFAASQPGVSTSCPGSAAAPARAMRPEARSTTSPSRLETPVPRPMVRSSRTMTWGAAESARVVMRGLRAPARAMRRGAWASPFQHGQIRANLSIRIGCHS